MDEKNFRGGNCGTEWPTWLLGLVLGTLILAAVINRIPGLFWLVDVAPTSDYSFNGDDQRFVDLAKDFTAGMPDGYVHGMTTQLLGISLLADKLLPDSNLLQLLKIVTLIYAALTLLLTFFIAKSWLGNDTSAILATFFLATAPLHIVSSNFGTADVTAVFYFYLTLFVAAKYLKTRDQIWFVLAAILTGAAIAIKFFIPLFVPLALLAVAHRGKQLITQTLTAFFLAIGSFELILLFAYTPWDFYNFYQMLRYDNVTIVGGNNPIKQLILYLWDFISAASIPLSIILAIAATLFFVRLNASRLIGILAWIKNPDTFTDWPRLITPQLLLTTTLLVHGLLITSSGIHAARHLLVFLPAACIVAAHALDLILQHFEKIKYLKAAVILVLVLYGSINAFFVEKLYADDVRKDVARSVNRFIAQGDSVVTANRWSLLKDMKFEVKQTFDPSTVVVTCDLEFNGYLRGRDASKIYGTLGGQPRLEFFWDVFEERSNFKILEVHKQPPLSFEQKLIDMQILRPIGSFVPKICLILGTKGTGLSVPKQSIFPKVYYTAGW